MTSNPVQVSIEGPTCKLAGTVPALNGLRGIAVVLVFLFHAGVPGFSGSFLGVDIFFVLSGFLITALLLQEHQSSGRVSLKKFYLRRILRLFPALLFMITAYLLYSYLTSPAQWLYHLQDSLMALLYAANWTRAFDLGRPTILGHCWSLSIEEQFYVVWPLLLLPLLRFTLSRRIAILAGMFIASWSWRLWLLGHGASWDRLYNGFGSRADMLLAGCLLACLWNAGKLNAWGRSRLMASMLSTIAVALLILMSSYLNWQSKALYAWQYELIALATSVIILDVLMRPAAMLNRILSLKVFVWLGVLSYAIYLWHYPVLYYCSVSGVHGASAVALAAILTLVFAVISRHLVEKPALRWRR